MSNAQIAAKLRQLGLLLDGKGSNRFKAKAYRKAAEAVSHYPRSLSEILAADVALPKLPAVGAGISAAIAEIVRTGSTQSIDRMNATLPSGALAIAEAAQVTVPEATRLMKLLDVQTPEELKKRIEAPDSETRLGSRLHYKVRQGLADVRRLLWPAARNLAEQLHAAIIDTAGVEQAEIAGSVRRGKETVGTIRLVVKARNSQGVRLLLRRHGAIESVVSEDESRVTCKLAQGPQLSVRFAKSRDWGTAMVEETGSRMHLRAITMSPRSKTAATEEAWYQHREMVWVPPELREGRGEVEAAAANGLPDLLEPQQIRGDLHCHTTESDGANTLEEMASAAQARGYTYLAITDHSKNLKITNGLDEKRLRKQMASIDAFNARVKWIHVFKGSEVDILEDGSLDFDGSILSRLDVVMASIHSRFALDKEQQTKRLLRAIENPYLTCIGHLRGRLLLKRPGYDLDIDVILDAVKKRHKMLEINSSPDRLDIDDEIALKALRMNIPILVNTDAHSIAEMNFMRLGVQQARRGWLSSASVVNAWPLNKVRAELEATRSSIQKSSLADNQFSTRIKK